ncbi:MAG: hypothetical protein R3E96_07570 [Planctomycetota bacterium]
MGAPDWCKPGTRITWWMGTATIVGGAGTTTAVEDPNGDLQDSSGKRYRQDSVQGGMGAAGFMQYDVIYAGPDGVLMDVRQYTGDGSVSAPSCQMVNSVAVHPGSCEFWIHPDLLRALEPAQIGNFRILKGPYKVNGRTYNAVMFTDNTAGDGSTTVFDMEAGLQISMSSQSTSTKGHTAYDPNTGNVNPGSSNNKTMVVAQIRGMRQMNLPWAQGPALKPTFQGGTYQGSQGIQSSMGSYMSPIQETVSIVGRGANWFLAKGQRTQMGESMGSYVRANALNQIGGWQLPVEALARLRQGQVLDQDPITRTQTVVEYVGPSNNGQPILGIVEVTPGSTLRWIYDTRTGELTASGVINPIQMGDGATVTQLERVGGMPDRGGNGW